MAAFLADIGCGFLAHRLGAPVGVGTALMGIGLLLWAAAAGATIRAKVLQVRAFGDHAWWIDPWLWRWFVKWMDEH
jgi:hypothetical protein